MIFFNLWIHFKFECYASKLLHRLDYNKPTPVEQDCFFHWETMHVEVSNLFIDFRKDWTF